MRKETKAASREPHSQKKKLAVGRRQFFGRFG